MNKINRLTIIKKSTLFYVGYAILVVKYGMASTQHPFSDTVGHILVGISCIFFTLKILWTNNSLKEYICYAFFASICSLIFVFSGDDALLIFLLAGIAMKETDLKELFKIWVWIYGAIISVTVISSVLAPQAAFEIGRYDGTYFEGIERYSLGFSHPNALQGTFFRLVCGILVLTDSWIFLLIAGALNVLLYMQSKSRTGFISITILIFGFWIMGYYGKRLSDKNMKRITMMIETLIVFMDLFIVYTYGKYALLVKLDSVMTGRFSLAYRLKETVPISLFGRNIFEYNAPFAIDNGIWAVIISYGLVAFIIFFSIYLYAIDRFNDAKYYQVIIIIIVCTLYSMSESTFGNLFINPALIIIFYMMSNNWKYIKWIWIKRFLRKKYKVVY